jgi:hypothetical protein
MIMKKNLFISFVLLAFTAVYTTCAASHPNEKLIVGKWKTVSVEKVLPENPQQQPTGTTPPSTPKTEPAGTSKGGSKGSGAGSGDAKVRAEEQFNRLYIAEQKATLEITANKYAIKDFNGTFVKATWKMKANGTKIVAKNIKTKEKYVLEILELTETKAVILEKLPAGSLKITYARE